MAGLLGTDKDLEKLARIVRKRGGDVVVDNRNHLTWHMPDGEIYRTGLTMNRSAVSSHRRNIMKRLGMGKHG